MMMPRLPLGLLAALQLAAAAASAEGLRVLPPTPPPMSEWQQSYMEFVAADAKVASASARPELLAALDDADLRAMLDDCCPGIAKLPAERLLGWYHAQISVTEMVHNFDAAPAAPGSHGHGGDPDLAVYDDSGTTGGWFYNLWTPWVLNLTNSTPGGPEDAMETGPFHMKEFANGRSPASLDEAAQRPVYTAFNDRLVDAGNPHFGDICMVFSPDYVRPMTIVAPMDTGLWVMLCNQSGSGFGPPPPPCYTDTNRSACEAGWGCEWANATAAGGAGSCASWGCANVTSEQQCDTMEMGQMGCDWSNATSECTEHHHHHGFGGGGNNCSVPYWDNRTHDFHLGTLESYDHLLLAGARWWNNTVVSGLGPQFARMYNSSGYNITSSEWFKYWEADIVGTVSYPAGIKMVVATFRSLFGTDLGTQVRAWCRLHGWPLAWALGPDDGSDSFMDPSHNYSVDARVSRLLDPSVLPHSSAGRNTSVAEYEAAVASVWAAVAAAKSANTTTAEYVGWWAQLPAGGLTVRALLAGDCADASKCIGSRLDGHCVCYE
jgi:hypothetical protein